LETERLDIEEGDGQFSVTTEARCRNGDATLLVRTSITGSAEGKLVFDAEAIPDHTFITNRCGFCILHPIVGVSGAPARVEHVDGSVREARFPAIIEPAQPFMDLRAITHWPAPGIEVRCLMEGDTFEM